MFLTQIHKRDVVDSLHIQFLDICSSVHYLFVIPLTFEELKHKHWNDVNYAMLTFASQGTTVQQLSLDFQRIMPQFRKWEGFRLSFSKGYLLPNEWTIKDMKRRLNRTNIDGIVLLVYDDCSRFSINSKFYNETCLQDYLHLQKEYYPHPAPFQLKFVLPGCERNIIVVYINYQDTTLEVFRLFLKEIARQFNINLSLANIERFIIRKDGRILTEEGQIGQKGLSHGDELLVEFFDKDMMFIRENTGQDKRFIIYKFEANHRQNYIQFYYSRIKYDTVGYIYERFFGESLDYKDRIYLKVMDLIIQQDETLERAEGYFHKTQDNDMITIVGHIINQKTLFYHHLKTEGDSFIEYSQIQPDESKRAQVDRQITIRASELKGDKFIPDKSHLQPIYLYTSQVRLGDLTIYNGVNSYLRAMNVSEIIRRKTKEEWRYRFMKTLIKRIEKIQDTKIKVVYRGVNYIPPQRQGEIIRFSSFLSTSTDQDTAYKFPIQQMNTKKIKIDKLSLFIMKINKGKAIGKYSAKKSQKQVLLQPFSQFLVKRIYQKSFKYIFQEYQFVVFQLEQINCQQCNFPQIRTTFLLWVDDKPAQGLKLYKKIIQLRQTLIFKQFFSTEQFRIWLQKYGNILKDKTANILVITSMIRVENGIANQIAGLQSLRQLREYNSRVPVIFYINNIEKTILQLIKVEQDENLSICNQQKQLISLISRFTNIQFSIKTQKVQKSCTIQ